MKYCPITYEIINDQESYSQRGLRLLSPQLKILSPLELSADEQRQEALDRVGKMSIQGVQKKLSAQLKVKAGCFEIVDQNGHYILKPQSDNFPELPENEAITMSLAKTIGLEVPVHGLVYSKDNSMTYFIKRFDRIGHNKKLAVEDFAQLSGEDRHTKYQSSMEKVITVIGKFCTFPKIEFVKLFKLTLFNFLIGNEDMHLKNFSLITKDKKISLSPAYDLLNSTIALKNAKEEMALPLRGRKNNLTKRDFFQYLAVEQLSLNQKVIAGIIQEFQQVIPRWRQLIGYSYLSQQMQEKYLQLLDERCDRLDFFN
ncbi:HipA domain-containing protein [Legionella cincinnatiensis]|uniref:DNA-binding transcriptional regulator n=1 Tax=Legionella cincinnatiensis TaxID=28085 RepID=A0A378IM53_9GAMM|nr:HipA domain-containing protein [Legionella cincinnatiensis]KTC85311.1 putative DNA-binding transcriptional regulator [Legionella cincinnatiensis]STX36327.1 putative DNA-binding transcriptional regulator [Legionella cincinnatiensis]